MASCILFLLMTQLFSFSCCRIDATAKSTDGNETDLLALLDFKRALLQHSVVVVGREIIISWNDSSHFCTWEGVTCGRRHHQRVTRLDLDSKGLAGPLSPSVGNLSFLRVLNLQNNSFIGEIPSQIGKLFRLQELKLNDNSFVGEIPANISHCFDLKDLHVSYNRLVGKIPEELSALSRLTFLSIHRNRLTGRIPHFLGNLTSLEILSAADNPFGGSISGSLGRLKALRHLGLGGNDLSGVIPPSLYNLTSLTLLSVSENELYGSLPPNIGLMLPHLQFLQLSYNHFTGALPLSLSNCSDLTTLDLSFINLNGKIAIDFRLMKNLRIIGLNDNDLGSGEADEMNFIASLANCSNLEYLEVSTNKLKGSLPDSVGNLSSKLHTLIFQLNEIYGRLPPSIGNLVGLAYSTFAGNKFTGTIPSTIGNLRSLQRLYLGGNKFSGRIPDSVGNLSLLNELYMETNRLEGNIPTSLGNLQNLIALGLSSNNLSGLIPRQLFRLPSLSIALDLSDNHLYGTLPPDVGNLKNLGYMDLSKNELSGDIPSSLGSCSTLENLFLHENNFQGSIPSSSSSLKGIRTLDLSRNNLSGQIPIFFENFSMEYLNLSFNNFEGKVPTGGVFANLSAISVVGNKKLCGGILGLHLHSCSNKKQKKSQGLSHSLVIVISIVCSLLCVTIMLFLSFCWHKKTRKEKSLGQELNEQFLRVSYEMLLKATNGFSVENLIGSGGFGSVYKGTLDVDDKVVAIKVLNLQCRGASKSFMRECESLRNIRHRNLINVISACSSIDYNGNDFKAIVYNYMPNGSLEHWLHSSQEAQIGQTKLQRLNIVQRINIGIDVACALDYLHNQCENCIIHCDVKPSNILLDENMVAHVGDFGLAKLLLPNLTGVVESSSTGLRGTVGYAAPEYGMGSEVSTMGDVYSFGIILLEMVAGKRPTDPMFEGSLTLHTFVKMSLDSDDVMNALDPVLVNNTREEAIPSQSQILECMASTAKIGVNCSMELAQNRMDINSAINQLLSVKRNLTLVVPKA